MADFQYDDENDEYAPRVDLLKASALRESRDYNDIFAKDNSTKPVSQIRYKPSRRGLSPPLEDKNSKPIDVKSAYSKRFDPAAIARAIPVQEVVVPIQPVLTVKSRSAEIKTRSDNKNANPTKKDPKNTSKTNKKSATTKKAPPPKIDPVAKKNNALQSSRDYSSLFDEPILPRTTSTQPAQIRKSQEATQKRPQDTKRPQNPIKDPSKRPVTTAKKNTGAPNEQLRRPASAPSSQKKQQLKDMQSQPNKKRIRDAPQKRGELDEESDFSEESDDDRGRKRSRGSTVPFHMNPYMMRMEDAERMMMRKRYHYASEDDDDIDDMEASAADIEAEERRSAKIALMEDKKAEKEEAERRRLRKLRAQNKK
ncbi:hypothetical protein AKO1_011035 [Acrasis kona]|uniref:SPT2 chromatin protein n=1 Tax=Acrasis kona TaxID=1008807 RepID=A0AAW2YV10_9EUKA